MNKKDAARILAIIRVTYPAVKIDNPEMMALGWEMCLGKYETEVVLEAVKMHLKKNKYFPTIAEITELIPRANIMLSPEPLKIETSCIPYIYDVDTIRGMIEDAPTEECFNCKKFHKCFG